jgi:NAD(P)-dependent dehydrogenase (short-subunit alcohol dehydrogenase family)
MNKAIITGTTSGLGLELAKYLIAGGWKVYGLSKSPSKFEHHLYHHIEVDITNVELLKTLIEGIKETEIDLLVNNSAVFECVNFEKTELNDIDRIIDTNLKGTIYVTKFVLPLMKQPSRIFFINSVAGLEEIENQSIYCASKHGLTGFAGVLSKELQDKKIKVTSIHPGGINTPLWDNTSFHNDVNKLIDPIQIVKLVEFIFNSDNTIEYKTVKLFPEVEWHY